MLVVIQSYTGNLMSLLAVRYIPQPFQTLKALVDDAATTMIWEYGTASVNKFRVSGFHSNYVVSLHPRQKYQNKYLHYYDMLKIITCMYDLTFLFVYHQQTADIGILREVRESEAMGRIKFVLATEYVDILQRLVRPGTHALIAEDLTARLLMAQDFSETGKV